MMGAGKGGGKNALASKPNLLNALRIQTSSYGQVIPIGWGQFRISGRLLWAGDFTAIPHTSTTKVGGKGLGTGGGNAVTNTTYTYQTAVAIALCQGPVSNLGLVWDTKGRLTLLTTTVTTTVPGTPFQITPTPPGSGVFHSPRGVSRADAFSVSNNDFGSDGSVTLSGTQQTPLTQVGSSPAAGQFTVDPVTGKHTFNSADTGKTVTITYAYSVPDSNSQGVPATKLNLTLFLGSRPQTPWSYLTSAHPGQDLGYNGIAYVASSAMDLGESGTLPNLSYEILGPLAFGAGITDAEPSAIIGDLVNNPFYGMNGALALGDLTAYKNFCVANGLFLSPVLDAQQTAATWIQGILDVTNAAAVWSEGVLKIVPYGDTTAVANGATFIPNTTPIYDLTTTDLLSEVLVNRPSVADVMNSVSVEFVNRANDYNVDVAEDKDDAAIALFGLRKAQPVQQHAITTATVAKFAANLIRKRSIEIRASYTFTLGWQFNLLEPMDLVTLTVPELGYAKKPVRITAIREDDSGELQIDCEDFPWGTAAPTLYGQQTPSAFAPAANADPGSVNTPIIFEANDRLSLTGNYEVWLGVSGASLSYGGCHVWISPDNVNYVQVGMILGSARMGVLGGGGSFGVTGDPATGAVAQTFDLTQSHGTLTAGSHTDADNFRTLIYLGGELIAYAPLELISANVYRPTNTGGGSTYIRRGIFGSPITAHSGTGSTPVLRLDDAVFVWEADPTLVGTTVWFKFTSFNTFGLMEQSLANATAYSFAFNGIFGNHDETPANNATLTSAFVSGTADNIIIQGTGGAGTSYTAWKMKDQGGTRTIAAQTLTSVDDTGAAPQISTIYWISYDFSAATHRAWANYNNYVTAVYRGQMRVGSLTTCNAAGTGGVTGGLGGSGTGGSGAPGRPLPPM